ncbi:MAG: efflux RND transporter periplasmic adaptor subunit [Desulfuromusa sp.]|nr:efflux RND transporter periplasmic adaptor subunit [Desulfuromusa sp.]
MHRKETESKSVQWGLLLMVLLSALLLTGCDQKNQAPQQHSLPQVSFITVQPEKIMLSTELPGRTSAFRVAEIRPQVSGLVQKRLFTEGSDVKAGQVLYQIDPAPFEAALDNAMATVTATQKNADQARAALKASIANVTQQQATLALSEQNRDRFVEAYKSKAVSTTQRDQAVTGAKVAEAALLAAEAQVESTRKAIASAEAAIQQAEAALKTVEINLGYTKVTAPISGRIGTSNVTGGAIVTAYQPLPLATIQQLDPIYADVPQSTIDLLRLKRRLQDGRLQQGSDQNKVRLIQEDGTPYFHNGTLQFSDISVDSTTGSVTLRALFPNPEGELLPGMFVRAMIQEGVNEQAILVPQQGVSRDPKGNPYALVLDAESKAGFRPLTLDHAIGDKWLVSAGLAPGDQVIVEGLTMLRPGTPVKASPFQPATTPASAVQPPATAK